MAVTDLPPGHWLESVDSTQEEAKRLIRAGKVQGTAFVAASHQTAGKGTRGRRWESPENAGIYLSVIHMPPPGETFEATSLYTLSAGVACIEALELTLGIQAKLKPINDIYVDNKKLGGILVESDLVHNGITALITGIGINTHQIERSLDRVGIDPISIQELISEHAFENINLDLLLESLVAKICFWHGLVMQGQHGQVERAVDLYRIDICEK